MSADRDLATTRRHRVADNAVLHALRNAVLDFPHQGDDELTTAVGPARNGVTMVEVGYLTSEDGLLVVIQAMQLRQSGGGVERLVQGVGG